jgi:tetratricopeptide (TPR) repeat protein
MKPKPLTLLILTAIVMASVACGRDGLIITPIETATPPPEVAPEVAPAISLESIQEQKQTAELLSEKGKALVDTGNYEQAVQVLTQAIELWPDYIMYWYRALAHSGLGKSIWTSDVAQAVYHFNECVRDNNSALLSKHEMTDDNLNKLLNNNDNCEANRDAVKQSTVSRAPASKVSPSPTPFPEEMLALMGVEEGSDEHSAFVLWQQSNDLLDSGGTAEESIALLTQAIELSPHWVMYDARGLSHWSLGNYAQSCKDFKSALLLPHDERPTMGMSEDQREKLKFWLSDC